MPITDIAESDIVCDCREVDAPGWPRSGVGMANSERVKLRTDTSKSNNAGSSINIKAPSQDVPDAGNGSSKHPTPRGKKRAPSLTESNVDNSGSDHARLRSGKDKPKFRKSGTSRESPSRALPTADVVEPYHACVSLVHEGKNSRNLRHTSPDNGS